VSSSGAASKSPPPTTLVYPGEVLEPYAPHRRPGQPAERRERRSAPRAALATTVRVVEDDGTEWFGTSVTVSPFSVRIRPQAAVRPGRVVKLSSHASRRGPGPPGAGAPRAGGAGRRDLLFRRSQRPRGLAAQHADRPTPERVRRRQCPKRRWRC